MEHIHSTQEGEMGRDRFSSQMESWETTITDGERKPSRAQWDEKSPKATKPSSDHRTSPERNLTVGPPPFLPSGPRFNSRCVCLPAGPGPGGNALPFCSVPRAQKGW